ncbi:trigger factor-like [Bombus huntii]|uniref:trigger factor-like n=1 Tax=Bombus huntii TaxID=85661 RepID=UPI0021AAAE68|nr:trigger factor-like [Bombus huntii]
MRVYLSATLLKKPPMTKPNSFRGKKHRICNDDNNHGNYGDDDDDDDGDGDYDDDDDDDDDGDGNVDDDNEDNSDDDDDDGDAGDEDDVNDFSREDILYDASITIVASQEIIDEIFAIY